MNVDVVVPFADDGAWRARAWGFVSERVAKLGNVHLGVLSPDVPWCKAAAVAAGLVEAAAPILVMHDADVLVPLDAMRAAVAAVVGGVPWAIPHDRVWRLDQRTTECVFVDGLVPDGATLTRSPYVGMAGGGVVVLRREVYDDCPLDRRFIGWGGEDKAWGWALSALHGAPWRGDAALVHLWHPHAAPGARYPPHLPSEQLRRAYRGARDRPERMRVLVDGGK